MRRRRDFWGAEVLFLIAQLYGGEVEVAKDKEGGEVSGLEFFCTIHKTTCQHLSSSSFGKFLFITGSNTISAWGKDHRRRGSSTEGENLRGDHICNRS